MSSGSMHTYSCSFISMKYFLTHSLKRFYIMQLYLIFFLNIIKNNLIFILIFEVTFKFMASFTGPVQQFIFMCMLCCSKLSYLWPCILTYMVLAFKIKYMLISEIFFFFIQSIIQNRRTGRRKTKR